MDKNSIKKFAQYARSKLIPEMEKLVEMWDKATVVSWWINVAWDVLNDKPYLHYGKAHESLKREITRKGKKELAEQAAYIRFNRIVALRYMEMHNYLPTRSSFFESSDWSWSPDIVTRALDEYQTTWIDKETVFDLYWKKNKELYAQLFISMCNKLSNEYGFMFWKLDDWTSLLFPMSLLDTNGIIKDDTNWLLSISDENRDEVEIIWWVYQYYISEQKDQYFEEEKTKKKKFWKKELWAVTQLFTPKWIVKYMVQNTVGKTWLQNYPDLELQKKWEFYIEGESKEHVDITDPIELTLLDPACWSGHILVVGFEVLYEIYKKAWYSPKQIPQKIIENNLYGFEIDERAHQLACFAVLMKAKQYDEDIQNKVDITNHIICIWENNNFEKVDEVKYPDLREFLKLWYNWKVYWSLIKMDEVEIDEEKILSEFKIFERERGLLDYVIDEDELKNLIHQYYLMSNKYVCVVANPPYMWWGKMDIVIKKFIVQNYKEYSSDLFSAFIIKNLEYTLTSWCLWFMTPFVWMFIQSYKNLRNILINNYTIDSLVELEYSWFDWATVPVCTFVVDKNTNYSWTYIKLSEFKWAELQEPKTLEAIKDKNCPYKYNVNQRDFLKIPESPISFWMPKQVIDLYRNKTLWEFFVPKTWLKTWDTERFIRSWYEVNIENIWFWCKDRSEANNTHKKRFPINKWWDYRKWFWNNMLVVNRENDWKEIIEWCEYLNTINVPWWIAINRDFYFKESISCSAITSASNSFRFYKTWAIFDINFRSYFIDDEDTKRYLLWLLNSKIVWYFCKALGETMALNWNDLNRIPFFIDKSKLWNVVSIVKNLVNMYEIDWNSSELSYDFKWLPLIDKNNGTLKASYKCYENKLVEKFEEAKKLETTLNEKFNETYWLENFIEPVISDDTIALKLPNLSFDIKSLLSYIIWCMQWRYSLDQEWLVYAWWNFDASKYKTFEADDDGILPVLYDSYFEDDVVDRTKEFVKEVWWEENFDENWVWLAQSIDEWSSKSADEIIRNYYNKSFMEDHFNTYQKRPIYRYFVSNSKKPKESAFKCIVYLHRYNKDTISIIRSKYLYKFQSKLEEELARLSKEDSRTAEKRCEEIRKQLIELWDYDKLLKDFADKNIELDLDDWVKVNYTKLMDAWIVAKLKI